jgi:hypothetical protein
MNRIVTTLVLVLGISWTNAWSQRRPAGGRGSHPVVVRSAKSEGSLAVSIVPVAGGPSFTAVPSGLSSMQLGAVSSGTGARNAGVAVERRQHSMVVRALFGLKVENPGAQQGTATLSAFLFRVDPRCDIFLDGLKLGTSPRLIEGRAAYGVSSPHRLEVEIPSSVPESQSQIVDNVGFLAVPN